MEGPSLEPLPELGMDHDSVVAAVRHYLNHTLGREEQHASTANWYEALALALRDRQIERWKRTQHTYAERKVRRTHYLSMEFLMGRTLANAALNLGLPGTVRRAMSTLGLRIEELENAERDAGLGNGGLGRLAACFLDSCATLQLPVIGYGIRYEYGMFRQRIVDGHQIEEPDQWLREDNPWELERPEDIRRVRFGGRTEWRGQHGDSSRVEWLDTEDVLAVPYDVPVPGYRNGTVNTLRLWSAAATDEFALGEFNAGKYPESVAAKNNAEHISMVLYPNDATENGKELRLRQQYFLASASLQDVLARWVAGHGDDFARFADKNCFQLNDTHPTCCVPELMRLLIDVHGLGWDDAWSVTTNTMAYTNHTLLPEALERWSVEMFGRLLPRLLEIVYEINARLLEEVARRWPGDRERQRQMSIIEEGAEPQVRMAYLAVVGSFSVNGVAALHSDLLQKGLLRHFSALWPKRFNNKTNGVTQRRWLLACNPGLASLIGERIGDAWITDLSQLARLTHLVDDEVFRDRWREVKAANKRRLAAMVQHECGVVLDPRALFDVQVKRIHEYKRQLLNVLHVIHLYDRLKRKAADDWTPRCVLIAGKAAPGYEMAKRIIKLANCVARVVNRDSEIGDRLKVVFLPDFRVSSMEVIAPGADLSEQISTAGKEASGTGNMKLMMNGAVTVGTLDGANIEILEAVGADNFFLFGMSADQVEAAREDYDPESVIAADPDLSRVMRLIESGHFNQFEPGIFDPIVASIRSPRDPWMTAADFRSFTDVQGRVAAAYRDVEAWTRMSILNCAHSGRFSTDRTIREYNDGIWRLEPVDPGAQALPVARRAAGSHP